MSEHYFTASPAVEAEERAHRFTIRGVEHAVVTASGVFSADRLDKGTQVLLDHVPDPPKTGTFLVEISATSTDPDRAHAIAQAEIGALDSVARGQSYLVPGGGDLTLAVDNPPTTPTSPSSLSALSTTPIGAAIGLAAGAVMAILLYFLSQKNPQDKVEDPLLIIGRRRSREDS